MYRLISIIIIFSTLILMLSLSFSLLSLPPLSLSLSFILPSLSPPSLSLSFFSFFTTNFLHPSSPSSSSTWRCLGIMFSSSCCCCCCCYYCYNYYFYHYYYYTTTIILLLLLLLTPLLLSPPPLSVPTLFLLLYNHFSFCNLIWICKLWDWNMLIPREDELLDDRAN